MRPALRTAAFLTAAGLAVLVALSAAALLAFLVSAPSAGAALAELPAHPWWFAYAPAAQGPAGGAAARPLWSAAAALAAAAVALPGILRARALAARSSPPTVLFLALFLLTLCVEGLRVHAAALFATGRSIAAAVALTRAVYGARFLGLLALLALGLYGLEMRYGRHVVLAAVAAVIALAVAVSVPVDRTAFLAQLTFKLGDEQSVWFASLVLSIVVVAAGAGAAWSPAPGAASSPAPGTALTRRRGQALGRLGGSILLLGGREMLCFAAGPATVAAGACLLAAGTWLWLRAMVAAGSSGRAEGARSP